MWAIVNCVSFGLTLKAMWAMKVTWAMKVMWAMKATGAIKDMWAVKNGLCKCMSCELL